MTLIFNLDLGSICEPLNNYQNLIISYIHLSKTGFKLIYSVENAVKHTQRDENVF